MHFSPFPNLRLLQSPPLLLQSQQVHPVSSLRVQLYFWPAAALRPVHRPVSDGSRARIPTLCMMGRCGISVKFSQTNLAAIIVRYRLGIKSKSQKCWILIYSVSIYINSLCIIYKKKNCTECKSTVPMTCTESYTHLCTNLSTSLFWNDFVKLLKLN